MAMKSELEDKLSRTECYESGPEFFWTEILGGCGCGRSEDLQDKAWALLQALSERRAGLLIYDDLVGEVLAHWMDSEGLIEHGTSISGSWLTEDGKALWARMNEAKFTRRV